MAWIISLLLKTWYSFIIIWQQSDKKLSFSVIFFFSLLATKSPLSKSLTLVLINNTFSWCWFSTAG
ncbi:MAG: hypothetical protein MRERV_79c009 [Mycoplasmataceae bacterium RV_VA103A]|nr:MAG: hypothetical protein MRERV_79c009 [Mycoplasmataceae bacterium RV_VA103A]